MRSQNKTVQNEHVILRRVSRIQVTYKIEMNISNLTLARYHRFLYSAKNAVFLSESETTTDTAIGGMKE